MFECLSPDQPAEMDPGSDAQGDAHLGQASSQHEHQRDQQQDRRDRVEGRVNVLHDVIHALAKVSGQYRIHQEREEADQGGEAGDDQSRPAALQRQVDHIAPYSVGAEEMLFLQGLRARLPGRDAGERRWVGALLGPFEQTVDHRTRRGVTAVFPGKAVQ